MGFVELLLLSVGLAMDAFAVSVCKGLNMKRINYRHGFIIALFFGIFQAGMPVIGWLLGVQFQQYINEFDHWIAFVLLGFIGGKMIYEAVKGDDDEGASSDGSLDIKELFVLSVATSIDALAVGVTFAFLDVNIWLSVSCIGIITLLLSFIGIIIGNNFGAKYKSRAELAGGIILVLIGVKILVEHLIGA